MKEPAKYNLLILSGVLLILIAYALDMFFVISPVISAVQAGGLPAMSVGSYFNFTVPIHPFALLAVFLAIMIVAGIVSSYAPKMKSISAKFLFELPLFIPLAFSLWIFTILIYGIFIKVLYYQWGANIIDLILVSPTISILLFFAAVTMFTGSMTGIDYLTLHRNSSKRQRKVGVKESWKRKRNIALLTVGMEGLVFILAAGYTQLTYLPYVGIVLIVASLAVHITDPK